MACEDEPLHVVFRHLDHTLFKNATKRLVEDVCISGASQPVVIGEARLVVCKGYVARQVQELIATRERWLQRMGLPMNTTL